MKVSPEMRGCPGKCIACRQKLLIPGVDDLPPETTEIHLADHPEFLRNVLGPDKQKTTAPPEDAPIDLLPRLQRICSFEHTLRRQLHSLEAGPETDKKRSEKEVLLGYRSLVNTAHQALNEQLQKKRHDTTEQLSVLQETLAKTSLALRTGESHYPAYQGTVFELRTRREMLIRRLRNLDAWLESTDPFHAGGLVEVDFNDIPTEHPKLELAEKITLNETLLVHYSSQLRKALRRKDLAKREWQEWRSMEKDGVLRGETREDCRDEGKAAVTRARTMVAFCRERLEQIEEDCEDDLKAIEAHRKIAQQQHAQGAMTGEQLQQTEMELAHGKSALTQTRQEAEQAFKAKNPEEIPSPRSTAVPDIEEPSALTMDKLLAWGAVILLILAMILPFSLRLGQRYGNFVTSQPLSLSFLIIASLIAATTMLRETRHRGIAYTVLWLTGTTTSALILFSLFQESTPLGGILRTDTFWILRPGLLAAILASVILGIAAWRTLYPLRSLRIYPAMTTCILLLGLSALLTSGFASYEPKLALTNTEQYLASTPATLFDVTLTLQNKGRRSLWLGKTLQEAPAQAILRIERNEGAADRQDWSLPLAINHAKRGWMDTQYQDTFPAVQLQRAETIQLRYEFPAGEYRIRIFSGRSIRPRDERLLHLSAPAQPMTPEVSLPKITPTNDAIPDQPIPIATVTLRGTMVADKTKPKFMVEVTLPTGESERKDILLNHMVIEPWKALEYNPSARTLTLTDGKRMRILKTGEALTLD